MSNIARVRREYLLGLNSDENKLRQIVKVIKLRPSLIGLYILSVILYGCFTLIPAPNPLTLEKYKISSGGLRLIDLTIILILAAIWYAGFYGYSRLKNYTETIKRTKEGKHIAVLTKGLFFLVLWLPVSSVTSAILGYFATRHTALQPGVTIVDNYVNLLFPLISFVYIGIGAHRLGKLAKRLPSYKVVNVIALLIIYIGLVFYHLIITTSNRGDIYHLSLWLLLTTIIGPYVYMWFTASVATYELYCYQQRVAGIIYRNIWKFLSLGIGWLIVTSIAFQYVTTLSARLDNLSLYWLLAIIYSLLIVLSLGFIFIAAGSRKLQRLEEV